MNTETTTATATPAIDTRPREAKMSPLEFMQALVYGYVSDGTLQARYGYRMRFQDRAVARFGAIAGWIVGLKHAGQVEFAERAAEDIDSAMQRLTCFAGKRDVELADGNLQECRDIVTIGDDGTFGGLSFCVWRAIPQAMVEQRNTNAELKELSYVKTPEGENVRWYDGYCRQDYTEFVFAFNGGVIYHGPGRGETFTVDFGSSRMWGIHT